MTRYRQGEKDQVLSIPGVVSVGEGMQNGRRVTVVGVEDQQTANDSRIPSTLGGLPVVVEVEGSPGFAAAEPPLAPPADEATLTAGAFTGKYRPVPPGVSIGHVDVTAGTSSFLATDGNSIKQLANNHVIANRNQAAPGDMIVQPGVADGGIPGEDDVGQLDGHIEMGSVGNTVDIAWYEPSVDVTENIIDVGAPTAEPADPDIGDPVTFAGRTSGIQAATVDRIDTDVEVKNGGSTRFTDVFRLDTPLQAGDSGAPILISTGDGAAPTGVGFASTDDNGWCMYASNVVAETGLDIILSDTPGGGASANRIPTINRQIGAAAALLGFGAIKNS